MKSNHQGTNPTPSTLLDELRALVTQAEQMIGQTQTEPEADVLGGMRARFDAAQERLSGLYQDARKKIVAGAKSTDDVIRANPYQSIAIAAGIGLLVGVLAGRSSK
ncbi:MAG TPA: hypothetical protein VHE61_17885 [Opitutaceae bacterium]|nr:hypothetical protein [Opitutaceae bacterium]